MRYHDKFGVDSVLQRTPCPARGTFEPSTGSTNGVEKRNRLSVIGVVSGSPTQTIRLLFASGYLVDSGSAFCVLQPTPEETGNPRPTEHMNVPRYHLERYGLRSFSVAGHRNHGMGRIKCTHTSDF